MTALGLKQTASTQTREGWPAHGLVAQIYVQDSDALFRQAVNAGAKVVMPMTDMFFGSREGRVADPFGNVWTIATLKEEVSPREMQRRMDAADYRHASRSRDATADEL
jgi:PhnB protein